MLWPLAANMLGRSGSARGSPATAPAATSFAITRSELHADRSASHWGIVVTVQGRQAEAYPRPLVLAIIRDGDGNEIFRGQLMGDSDSAKPDADGMRTWTVRSTHPRTLAVERYHTLATSLIDSP